MSESEGFILKAEQFNQEEWCEMFIRVSETCKDLRVENECLQNQLQQKENIIKEVRECITSYESISTIQGLEDIEKNKDLDEKTLNEMVRRYMIVHDKLLKILEKENV